MRDTKRFKITTLATGIVLGTSAAAQTANMIEIQGSGYLQSADVDRGADISGGDPIVGFELRGQSDTGFFGVLDNKSRQSDRNDAGLESRATVGYSAALTEAVSAQANIANTWLFGSGEDENEDYLELTTGMEYSQPEWAFRAEAIFDFDEPNNTLQGEWVYTPTYQWFGFMGAGYAAFSDSRENRAFANAGLGRRWQGLDFSAAYHVSSLSGDELSGNETSTDAFVLRMRARF